MVLPMFAPERPLTLPHVYSFPIETSAFSFYNLTVFYG